MPKTLSRPWDRISFSPPPNLRLLSSAFVDELKSGAQMFYVVDPSGTLYGGRISQEKLEALRRYAVDVTPEIEHSIDHRIPLEVFVPVTWTAVANLGGGQATSLGR
jgi:hypothetical protein